MSIVAVSIISKSHQTSKRVFLGVFFVAHRMGSVGGHCQYAGCVMTEYVRLRFGITLVCQKWDSGGHVAQWVQFNLINIVHTALLMLSSIHPVRIRGAEMTRSMFRLCMINLVDVDGKYNGGHRSVQDIKALGRNGA